MVRIFIWAARLPTVAVGLSAVRRFARAAPIPAATEPRGGIGIFHSVKCWCLQETHRPLFRGIPAVRFYLPVRVPQLAVGAFLPQTALHFVTLMWGY